MCDTCVNDNDMATRLSHDDVLYNLACHIKNLDDIREDYI